MTNRLSRINKFLADAGCCSRRQADEFIKEGRVKINDKVAKLGEMVGVKDQVKFDSQIITINSDLEYYLLYKPKGYICSSKDELGRKNCTNLIKTDKRLFTVGRLDKDSEGLIILTNDGYFAESIIHPSKKIEKVYEIELKGENLDKVTRQFTQGILIERICMKADKVEVITISKDKGIFNVSLHQGYNRQLRRMSASLDLEVLSLKRISIGNLKIDNLKSGEFRKLDPRRCRGG